VLFSIFVGSYIAYFGYVGFFAKKPWKLKIDPYYCPSVAILIPVHNEEKIIFSKLENLAEIFYPRDKLEVILIDDASTDKTLVKVKEFSKAYPEFPLKILEQNSRSGKAGALNKGLAVVSSEIVVVSDADAFLSSDVLYKALPYMSDSTVGALTGLVTAKNPDQSWVTKVEKGYLGIMSLLRVGESKVHSTLRFEGCFCAYRKSVLHKFDDESGSDDCGTALMIVQNGSRAILVPEVQATTEVPHNLKERTKIKVRRATQLTGLWVHCLKLFFRGRLMLPKRIALPEIFISIFNPFVFGALVFVTFAVIVYYPIFSVFLILCFSVLAVIPKTRNYLVQGIMDQLTLLYSLVLYASKKKFVTWDK